MTADSLQDDQNDSAEVVIRGKVVTMASASSEPSEEPGPAPAHPVSSSPPLGSSPPRSSGIVRPDTPPTPTDAPASPPPSAPQESSAPRPELQPAAGDRHDPADTSTRREIPKRQNAGEPEDASTFDDLYKRYVSKNPSKLGSLSPQGSSFLETSKYSAEGAKAREKEKEKDHRPALTTTTNPSVGVPSSRGLDITKEVLESAEKGEGEDEERDREERAAQADEEEKAAEEQAEPEEPQVSAPRDIVVKEPAHKHQSGSFLSTGNLTPGQESRLKYLEDYFEVLPTDDDETAEIKRKLVSKMKHRRQLSFQKSSIKLEDDPPEEEVPKSPVSPYTEASIQAPEEEESGPRGQSLTENPDERKTDKLPRLVILALIPPFYFFLFFSP